jgi:hypothetical protein
LILSNFDFAVLNAASHSLPDAIGLPAFAGKVTACEIVERTPRHKTNRFIVAPKRLFKDFAKYDRDQNKSLDIEFTSHAQFWMVSLSQVD